MLIFIMKGTCIRKVLFIFINILLKIRCTTLEKINIESTPPTELTVDSSLCSSEMIVSTAISNNLRIESREYEISTIEKTDKITEEGLVDGIGNLMCCNEKELNHKKRNAEFNLTQPKSYYDCENFNIELGDMSNYKILYRIKSTNNSNIYKGYKGDELIIAKELKHQNLIKNEIRILKTLEHENIIKFEDTVMDKITKIYFLIFDYIPHDYVKKLFKSFSLKEIKLYSKQILKALAYSHSKGIMHCDIKPNNLIINEKSKQLVIIDWGMSQFYIPNKKNNYNIGTICYNSPELLLKYSFYDYSCDIWSFGCIFAEMLFKKGPLFMAFGQNNQLLEIIKLLGYSDFNTYLEKLNMNPVNLKGKGISPERVDFNKFLPEDSEEDYSFALDLLNKVLVYDHTERYTAEECLQHPFFTS